MRRFAVFLHLKSKTKHLFTIKYLAGYQISLFANTKFFTMSEKAVKTRYTDSELEEFELLIDEKLSEARKQLDFYVQQLSDSSDNADSKSKGLDDSIGSVENEQISTLASRMRKHIQHLENAKLRIQNKVYGICRETGKLISKERLRAVPHATLSIDAKNKR